jgi:hypothetical protein
MNLPNPPADWMLTHLIFLDPEWQVNLRSEEAVIVATGYTPAEAMNEAIERIGTRWEKPRFCAPRLTTMAKNLLQELGLSKPQRIRRI